MKYIPGPWAYSIIKTKPKKFGAITQTFRPRLEIFSLTENTKFGLPRLIVEEDIDSHSLLDEPTARLIAAAPELLTAACFAVKLLEATEQDVRAGILSADEKQLALDRIEDDLEVLLKVIRKATGGE